VWQLGNSEVSQPPRCETELLAMLQSAGAPYSPAIRRASLLFVSRTT
jgi:hypothetical protein